MKSIFLSVLLALSLFAGCAATAIAPTTFVLSSEIGMCTAWPAISQDRPGWMVVDHCVGDHSDALHFTVNGVPVLYVKNDGQLALLSGGPEVQPFEIADKLPNVGDPVVVLERPYGGPQIFLRGFFSAPLITIGNVYYTLFQVPAAGGASGSPILDKHNHVVGAVTSVPCNVEEGFCAVLLAVPLSEIQEFVK